MWVILDLIAILEYELKNGIVLTCKKDLISFLDAQFFRLLFVGLKVKVMHS